MIPDKRLQEAQQAAIEAMEARPRNEAAEEPIACQRCGQGVLPEDQPAHDEWDAALAAERRAGRRQALGECMCEKCEPEWTAMVLDEEAAR